MSAQIHKPHDTFVRKALEDMRVVRSLLQCELPEQIAAPSNDRRSILEKIEMYLRYVSGCSKHINEETIRKSIEDSEIREEIMATLAQKWMNEGEARGIIGGQSALLRKLIKLRFGQIPPYVEGQLAAATAEQLERFAENVLTATTAEEVVTLN
ncbi:MAG: DUF4351 domain-containing protein [Desulfuromonas sp.]|nr:DUF4351 domain-containing protein [Desulfuromonas sp.]